MGAQFADNDSGRNTMKPKTTSQAKKPYRSPRLEVYGDLRRLTQTKGSIKPDAGGGPKSKLAGGPT